MSEAIWQEVECGAYTADLALLRELAAAAAPGKPPASVLDIGGGIGRVALPLARDGHRVTVLDSSRELLDELLRRAAKQQLEVSVACEDARAFDLDRRFNLVAAPMQLLQLLGGSPGRRSFFRSVRRHVSDRGRVVVVLMDLTGEPIDDEYLSPLPDVREIDGTVYSSLPVAVRTFDRGHGLALDRVRTIVTPDGALHESANTIKLRLVEPERIEAEARLEDLAAIERIEIPATDDHVGSVALLFEPA